MRRIDGPRAAASVLLLLAGTSRAVAVRFEAAGDARAFLKTILATDGPRQRAAALIKTLRHREATAREDATLGLIELGAVAIPLVEKAAKSDDPEVRARARRVLDAHRIAPQDRSWEITQAIDVLAAAKDRWALVALLQFLDHPGVDVRYAAEYGLRRLTRQRFGYNAYTSKQARNATAARWRHWWGKARATYRFDAPMPVPPKVAGVFLNRRCTIVDLQGNVVWQRPAQHLMGEAVPLPNGHVLVWRGRGRNVRLEEIDSERRVVWCADKLVLSDYIYDVQRLVNGNTLVADLDANEVLEVDTGGAVVWRCRVALPMSVERLPNGNTLVAVHSRLSGRVVELSRPGKTVWSTPKLILPSDAEALPGGNVLVAESGGQRVVEFDRGGKVVWQFRCLGEPVSARRLPDGTTVLVDSREGLILVGKDGKLIRRLAPAVRSGRLSLVPALPAWQKQLRKE